MACVRCDAVLACLTCLTSPVTALQLMFSELYDLEGCAAFVADFLAFEPLEDPLHPPEFLPSPTNTLLWQVWRRCGPARVDFVDTG